MALWPSRREREVRNIGKRLDGVLAQAADFRAGRGNTPYADVANSLYDFIMELMPAAMDGDYVKAGAVFDAARQSLILESAGQSWVRACGAGLALGGSIPPLTTMAEERGEKFLSHGFWERLRGLMDEAAYSAHRASTPTAVARIVETITGDSFTTRQLLHDLPVHDVAAVTARAERAASALEKVQLFDVPGDPNIPEIELASWENMLHLMETALRLPSEEMIPFSIASGAVSPISAMVAKRDLIYLAAGSRGGTAVRFFHGRDVRRPPAHIELPECSLQAVRRIRAWAEETYANTDGRGRRAIMRELEAIGDEIGRTVLAPLDAAWPDMDRIALIPFGEMQSLPLANARIQGANWSSRVDTTVAPNAQCLLVASLQPATVPSSPAVLGDCGSGTSFLPCVRPEVESVAALYARTPDLLVDDGSNSSDGPIDRGLRRGLSEQPARRSPALNLICRADIVHIACHGVVPEGGNRLPVLYLDGALPLDELEERRLRPGATVVLSACSAGGALREAPLELLGFPAAMLSIGARAVIASMWPVPDSPETIEFMVELHRNLRSGLPASQALAITTSLAVQKGIPYAVWGPFAAYGA